MYRESGKLNPTSGITKFNIIRSHSSITKYVSNVFIGCWNFIALGDLLELL